jgi:hypothetical protein
MIYFKQHTPLWKRFVTFLSISFLNCCFIIWEWLEYHYLAQMHVCPMSKSVSPSDRWTETTWSRLLNLEHKILTWGNAIGGIREVTWFHKWVPRSCTFCGSIYPEDAIRLCSEGWTVDRVSDAKYSFFPREWIPKPQVVLFSVHVTFKQLKKLEEVAGKQLTNKANYANGEKTE